MKKFNHMAMLIKTKRRESRMSQLDLKGVLNMPGNTAQFISNVERGLCGMPLKHLKSVCKELKITKAEAMKAWIDDHREHFIGEWDGQET